jgi:hypothetical protein
MIIELSMLYVNKRGALMEQYCQQDFMVIGAYYCTTFKEFGFIHHYQKN